MVARKGGTIAGNARKELEEKLGDSIISTLNAKSLKKEYNKTIDKHKE